MINIEIRLKRLIESGKKAFDLLLEEVEKPIDPELQDDKARNAMKAKKECFMDAQEILRAINKIENQLAGDEESSSETTEGGSFRAGFSERFAKK